MIILTYFFSWMWVRNHGLLIIFFEKSQIYFLLPSVLFRISLRHRLHHDSTLFGRVFCSYIILQK